MLAQWAILGYELSVLNGRSLNDTDEGKNYLETNRLIVGDEWDSMVEGDTSQKLLCVQALFGPLFVCNLK